MELPRARAFGSLRSRNVRLFLGGQSVSLVGTWVQQVAMGWLAYRLTGSPLLLGVLAAAGQLPSLLLMPIRSEEHTSELQSLTNLVCRLLLEKKKNELMP